jgi:hypothetical protein
MSSTGAKIRSSTVRPRVADVEDGFKLSTMVKHKITGNLQQSFDQVQSKLKDLRTARNALIDPNIAVDIAPVLASARAELLKKAQNLKNAGRGQQVLGAFDKLSDDVFRSLPNGTTVPLTNIEDAKESFGIMGAWAYGRQDFESSAIEEAANAAYTQLKKAIEQAVPNSGKLASLNKQMGELIPVRNAMLARIPVEERNRMFSLADITAMVPAAVTGDVTKIALLAGTRAQKSLRVGNWLSNNAQNATGAAAGLGKLLNLGYDEMTNRYR